MSSLEKSIYLDFFSFYKGVIKFLPAFALKNNKTKTTSIAITITKWPTTTTTTTMTRRRPRGTF